MSPIIKILLSYLYRCLKMEFKLIIKKLNNTITPSEEETFKKWYQESQTHQDYFNHIEQDYQTDLDYVDIEKGWLAIQDKVKKSRARKAYWRYTMAASVVILAAFGLVFKNNNIKEQQVKETVIVKEESSVITVGTDKATLTLADGSNVALERDKTYQDETIKSDGKTLVYNATSEPKKEIEYNYLTIPRGGQFQITLSDGTQVWLNSESQLKYPVSFADVEPRQVELVYGEAYFDVSPSTLHKGATFKVLNKNQEIEVTGTEFNIKAYKEEDNIYTTLVEGEVRVTNGTQAQTLKPNQQSEINIKNKSIVVNYVDVHSEISWKKGLFSFKSMPLKNIMVVLSRWYDVEVEFFNQEAESVKFNGVLSKNDNIEEILKVIKNTKFINAYEIINKKVIIK